MAAYGIATIFNNTATGTEFRGDNLPLHLTHVDSFEINGGIKNIEQALQKELSNHKSFEIAALTDVMYGPDKDIPVTTLELTAELTDLHSAILRILEANGAVFKNPHFLNQHYSPHVTIYGERRVQLGQKVKIKDVSIATKVLQREDDVRRVLATIELQ